jgi:hypothetical protein
MNWNVLAENPKDAGTYGVQIEYRATIPLPLLFRQLQTDQLYRARDLIDEVLASRADARK